MQQASGEGIHHPQFVGISCTSTHHRLIVECPTKLHFSAKDWYSYIVVEVDAKKLILGRKFGSCAIKDKLCLSLLAIGW